MSLIFHHRRKQICIVIYDQSSAQRDDKDFSSLHCRRSRLFQVNFAWGEGMGRAKNFGWEGGEGEKQDFFFFLMKEKKT